MYESILSVVALVSAYLAPSFENLPSTFEMASPQPSQVYAANGDLMFEFGANPEVQISFDKIGQPLIQAVLAAEDKTFFSHDGFQLKALARAAAFSAKSIAGIGSTRVQGGSTITQQLAKVLYTDRKANLRRKIVEAYIAQKLESEFSKQEILARYMNEIYLGNGVWGVLNASKHYFDKAPSDLTALEAATLAAMIRAPESMLRNHARLDKTRRQILATQNIEVIKARHKLADIAKGEIDLGLQSNPVPKRNLSRSFGYYEDQVMRDLQDLFGKERVEQGGLKIWTGFDDEMQLATSYAVGETLSLSNATMGTGKIRAYKTSNDLPAYSSFGLAADVIKVEAGWRATFKTSQDVESCLIPNSVELGRHVVKLAPYMKGISSLRVMPVKPELDPKMKTALAETNLDSLAIDHLLTSLCLPMIQSTLGAGATILDPNTGALKAIVGGVDYHATKFNRASQAKRQVGSLLKPFVYLAGVEKGFRLNQTLSMTAKRYDLGGGRYWRPRNAGKSNEAFISYEGALLRSKNVPTVNLTDILGFTRVYKRLKGLNAGTGVPRELAAVLGAGSSSVRDMAGDYAMFANERGSVPALTLTQVDDLDNHTIFSLARQQCSDCQRGSSFNKFLKRQAKQKQFAAKDLRTIRGVLARVPTQGTARRIGQPFDYQVFGKTGTTNAVKDAWFVGGTIDRDEGDLIVGTFLGYDSPKRIANYGSASSLAAPLFKAVLANLDGYKKEPVLIASANVPQNLFMPTKVDDGIGYRDLSTVSPSYTYSATLTGNVTFRKGPTGGSKYIRILNKGIRLAPVTCRGNWCKGTFAGEEGWFTKRWASLQPDQIIGGTLAFDHKHPVTAIAANFSSAVKTEALLRAEKTSINTKRTVTTKAVTKKKRRCKMVNLGGTMVQKCQNF